MSRHPNQAATASRALPEVHLGLRRTPPATEPQDPPRHPGSPGRRNPARRALCKALGVYCANRVYLSRTVKGACRVDLDGNPAGIVAADEEAHAKATLAGIKTRNGAGTAPAKAVAAIRTCMTSQPSSSSATSPPWVRSS